MQPVNIKTQGLTWSKTLSFKYSTIFSSFDPQ